MVDSKMDNVKTRFMSEISNSSMSRDGSSYMDEYTKGYKRMLEESSSADKKEHFLNILKDMDFWNREVADKGVVNKILCKVSRKDIDVFERFKSMMFLQYLGLKMGTKENYFYQQHNKTERHIKQAFSEGLIKSEDIFPLACSSSELAMLTTCFNHEKYYARVLRLNKPLQDFMFNTDIKKEYVPLPYNFLFLCFNNLVIDNVEIVGALLRDRTVGNDSSYSLFDRKNTDPTGSLVESCQGEGRALEIITFCIDNSDGEIAWLWDTYLSSKELVKGSNYFDSPNSKNLWCEESTYKKLNNAISNICLNTISLINSPEVEVITHSKSFLRENRVSKGKLGMPDDIEINLTGKLKRYINETIANNEKAWELGHKFWVRGHWMEFKDECYKNMRGKKKWILPYIKGKGELIKKDYYIGEKEQCWENQKRMIQIVQQLFPDKKIEKNNRTILEGLEIDCYIPELKIGFEYNGQQHYEHVECFHKTIEEFKAQQERDIEKNKRAIEKGIKLITIKYDEPLTEEHLKERL